MTRLVALVLGLELSDPWAVEAARGFAALAWVAVGVALQMWLG